MAWQTAWERTREGSWGDTVKMGMRNIIPANESSYNGTKIRITVEAGPSGSFVFDGTSIGVMTTGDDYDSTPTRITWDTGNDGATVSASSTKVSDEITFSFDKTKRYGIHLHCTSRQNGSYSGISASGYYKKEGSGTPDDTMTQTISYTYDGSYNGGVLKLEVFEGAADKFSNDAESKLLAHIFKNTQYSQPSNLYVALCKSTIEDDDTGSTLPSEVSGGSYQRTLCNTWDTSTTPGTADSDITIEFPKATAAWGTITDFAICDAQTLGNVICYGKFTTPRNIGNGDRFIIDTGDLDATLS